MSDNLTKNDLEDIIRGYATAGENTKQRIASLEIGQQNLEKEITSLSIETKKGLDTIYHKLGDFNQKLGDMNKTPWAVIFGGGAVFMTFIIAIIGAAGNGYLRDQDRHESAINILIDEFKMHQLSDGHPAVVQRVKALEDAVATQAQNWRREMEITAKLDDPIIEDNRQEILRLRDRLDKLMETK